MFARRETGGGAPGKKTASDASRRLLSLLWSG
jgi:hypothetical protein